MFFVYNVLISLATRDTLKLGEEKDAGRHKRHICFCKRTNHEPQSCKPKKRKRWA